MASLWMVGIQASLLVIITTISLLMPSLTRRDILFGATVSPNGRATPAGRAIIRRYRIRVLLLAIAQVVALALLWTLAPAKFWASGWAVIIPIALVLLLDIPYLLAWRSSRALAAVAPATSAPILSAGLRPRHYADYVPLIWEALPLALIALPASYLAMTYASAPGIIPTHFDAMGNPNAYAHKTIDAYFQLVWTQLVPYVLITFVSALTVRAKTLPTVADETFRRRMLRRLASCRVRRGSRHWRRIGKWARFAGAFRLRCARSPALSSPTLRRGPQRLVCMSTRRRESGIRTTRPTARSSQANAANYRHTSVPPLSWPPLSWPPLSCGGWSLA